ASTYHRRRGWGARSGLVVPASSVRSSASIRHRVADEEPTEQGMLLAEQATGAGGVNPCDQATARAPIPSNQPPHPTRGRQRRGWRSAHRRRCGDARGGLLEGVEVHGVPAILTSPAQPFPWLVAAEPRRATAERSSTDERMASRV
uniref:Uncharacterized protein n=1 Tax=Aegilops tauschii subsp. strangulata TaxID=200361 RepID=A0A453GMX8_AEGTS